jgi:hypothetical protein
MCNYFIVALLVVAGFAIGIHAGFLLGRHFEKAIR